GRELSAGGKLLNEKSCFACHTFEGDVADAGLPAIAAAGADCRGCHLEPGSTRHVDAGVGKCDYCHLGNESVYLAEPPEAFQVRPAGRRYDHHLDSLSGDDPHGHAKLACARCHEAVMTADTVAAITFPGWADAVCQECHGAGATGGVAGGSGSGGGAVGFDNCARCHSFHADTKTRSR
ncbi:MAG: multiheme c-type cytochrome, partial [Planctomycetota bacterium]